MEQNGAGTSQIETNKMSRAKSSQIASYWSESHRIPSNPTKTLRISWNLTKSRPVVSNGVELNGIEFS